MKTTNRSDRGATAFTLFEIVDTVGTQAWEAERAKLETALNWYGQQGWELVTFTFAGDKPTARVGEQRIYMGVFKRPAFSLPPPPPPG